MSIRKCKGMDYWYATIAGIAGTLLMTGYLYMLTYLTGRNFKVVRTLAVILADHDHNKGNRSLKPAALLAGITVHYAIGVFFALTYTWLWDHGIGKPDLVNGIIFGALNGLFAIGFWFMMITLFERPLILRLPMPEYLIAIGSGHLFFGIGTVFIFNLLRYFSHEMPGALHAG